MAVLITGGAGFVGLNVAEHLLDSKRDVVLFGPSPPPDPVLRALSARAGRVHFAAGDVSVRSDLDAVHAEHPIDSIVHCAAITADLARERYAARDIFTTNLLGTIEVLEAAQRHKVRRVVQIGTGAIFGAAGNANPVLDEQTSPASPESLYGISKFAAERVGLRYRTTRNLNVTVVRLGTVFGRWEYDTGVRDTLSMPLQLLRVAARGETVVVHRHAPDDWIYSVDVARGVVAILELPASPEPIYHLSSGVRWSIQTWLERLQQAFPKFNYQLADRLEDCTVRRNQAPGRSPLSIERIRRDTGFQPKYLLDRAFDDYMKWRSVHNELV